MGLHRERRRIEHIVAQVLALATPACSEAHGGGPDATVDDATADSPEAGATDAIADTGDPCKPMAFTGDAYAPDGGIECSYFFRLGCGLPQGVVPRQSCYFTINDCETFCPDP